MSPGTSTVGSAISSYIERMQTALSSLPVDRLGVLAERLNEARDHGRNIYIMGNGGSGATASHFVCDMNKGANVEGQKRFRVMCLNDSIATVLAYANDLNYSSVFVEQLRNFVQPNDIVIGISGSGNSENVILALQYAREAGSYTVAFVGFDGGTLGKTADVVIHTPVNDMQVVEDLHMAMCHMLMRIC